MKAVRERTHAQETAYKKAFRTGRTFKSKLDALVTLENKRTKERERKEEQTLSFGSGSWSCITGMAEVHHACSGLITDIDNRPDFRPDKQQSDYTGSYLPVMSG